MQTKTFSLSWLPFKLTVSTLFQYSLYFIMVYKEMTSNCKKRLCHSIREDTSQTALTNTNQCIITNCNTIYDNELYCIKTTSTCQIGNFKSVRNVILRYTKKSLKVLMSVISTFREISENSDLDAYLDLKMTWLFETIFNFFEYLPEKTFNNLTFLIENIIYCFKCAGRGILLDFKNWYEALHLSIEQTLYLLKIIFDEGIFFLSGIFQNLNLFLKRIFDTIRNNLSDFIFYIQKILKFIFSLSKKLINNLSDFIFYIKKVLKSIFSLNKKLIRSVNQIINTLKRLYRKTIINTKISLDRLEIYSKIYNIKASIFIPEKIYSLDEQLTSFRNRVLETINLIAKRGFQLQIFFRNKIATFLILISETFHTFLQFVNEKYRVLVIKLREIRETSQIIGLKYLDITIRNFILLINFIKKESRILFHEFEYILRKTIVKTIRFVHYSKKNMKYFFSVTFPEMLLSFYHSNIVQETLTEISLMTIRFIEWKDLIYEEAFREDITPSPETLQIHQEIVIKKKPIVKQDEIKTQGCSLEEAGRKKLGNGVWYLLHTVTMKYPENPTLVQQTDMAQFLVLLSRIFPCDECQGHFQKMIEQNRPDLRSKETFKKWMFDIHNIVNERLNKPQYEHENLEKDYTCGC